MQFRKTQMATAVSLALFAFGAQLTYAQAPAPAAPAAPKVETAAEKAAREKAEAERAQQTQQIERIVVTATGRAQAASSVPYNVTAISEEQLRDENITDIKKLIADSVSISAPGNSARFADSVTVRGLNVSSVTANNLEQFVRTTLAYYLDSTPLPNIGYRIKDISRVETLLGPQGTLYGAGSLGGTVRYITNQPKLEKTEARITNGFYQTKDGGLSRDTDVMLNMPFGSSVALRISLADLDEKGYTDRVSNPPWRTGALAWVTQPDPTRNLYEDDDWQKVRGGRLSLLWKINRDLSLTLSHAQQKQLANGTTGANLTPVRIANAQTPAELLNAWRAGSGSFTNACVATNNCRFTSQLTTPYVFNDRTLISRYGEFANRSFELSSADIAWDLPFARLTSSTSIFEDKRVGQADYASQGEVFYFRLGDAGGRIDSGRSAFITTNNAFDGLSHETRLTSKGDGPLQWIAGLYFTRQNRAFRFSEFLPGGDRYIELNRAAAGGNTDEFYRENLARRYRETAIYGEVGYKFTPAWLTTFGARAFNYKDTGIAEIRDYSFDLVNNNVSRTGGDNGRTYFKLNTSYQFNDDVLAYYTFSQGFRRGGTNPFRDVGTLRVTAENKEYEPDTTNNHEIGIKGSFFNRRWYVQTDVYQIDWKNPQTDRAQEIEGFPVNGTVNGPDARTRGWELQTRYRVTDNFSVTYNTAYSLGEWVETKVNCLYENNTTRECRTWGKGGKLGGSSRWKHNGNVRFNTTLENGLYLSAGLSARYVGKVPVNRTDGPDVPQRFRPAYALYNFSTSASLGNWDVNLWVQNLANKREVVSDQITGGTTGGDLLGARVILTTPRTIGTTITYTF
jgi:iron complex outermembrane recepter protein